MFIYSFRASTLKLLGIISVTLAALVAIIVFVPVYAEGIGSIGTGASVEDTAEYSYDKVKSAADAVNFLSQFGWTVDGGKPESAKVTIPSEFDKVFAAYIAVVCLALAVYTVSLYAMPEKYDESIALLFINILRVIALVANILLMISGGKEKKLPKHLTDWRKLVACNYNTVNFDTMRPFEFRMLEESR